MLVGYSVLKQTHEIMGPIETLKRQRHEIAIETYTNAHTKYFVHKKVLSTTRSY